MRLLFAAVAVTGLMAVTADAQYKKQAPAPTAPPATPGSVQITPGGATNTAGIADELSKARRIERPEAMKLVKQGKAIYVDVRSKESYDEGHIPGAISVPLSEMLARIKELPLKKLIITYCA
jgi:3-mercaptopyruvate sulfurtransferase SseA